MISAQLFDGWRPKAIVFDCDGLLMDTEPCWTVAETAVFARRGMPFGIEQKALLIGKSLEDAGETLAAAFGEAGSGPALAAELLELVESIASQQALAHAGARDLVALLEDARPIAVASNSARKLLDIALRRGGFEGKFPCSFAADEVEAPKPAPDLYLRACERLGVAPSDTLAFEDSMTGLRSARAAGLKVIGVPSLLNVTLPADAIFTSLEDRNLVEWAKALCGHRSD